MNLSEQRVAIVAQMAATIYPEMCIYYESDRAEKIAVAAAMRLYNRVLALAEAPSKPLSTTQEGA